MSGGNTGVKNLRAMFENKNTDLSTSPPSRGRSSSGSISSVNSRPVSKVRASFVAVERPSENGQPSQWGLRKTSDVSSMAEVREEALLEDEVQTPRASHIELGFILKGSPFEDSIRDKPAAGKPAAGPKKQIPNLTAKVGGGANNVVALAGKIQDKKDKPETTVSKASKIAVKSPTGAPASIDTKAASAKSKDTVTPTTKSPVLQKKTQDSAADAARGGTDAAATSSFKPRGGVSKIQGVAASAQKAKEERAKTAQQQQPQQPQPQATLESPKEVKPPAVALKQTAASKAHVKKPDAGQIDDAAQPKQPTAKPTKLPTAATTSTAASTARTDKDDTKSSTSDRRSTLTNAPRVANLATKATMAKKASRASLAGTEDRSKSRQSTTHRPADEGFLARMTRPTASSAQKAHAKVEVASPPRPRQSSASNTAVRKSTKKSESVTSKDNGDGVPSASVNEHESGPGSSDANNIDGPKNQQVEHDATTTTQEDATVSQQPVDSVANA